MKLKSPNHDIVSSSSVGRDMSFAKSVFLVFEEVDLESRFRVFLQPAVPLSMAAVYLVSFFVVLLGELTSYHYLGDASLASFAVGLGLFASFTFLIAQVVVWALGSSTSSESWGSATMLEKLTRHLGISDSMFMAMTVTFTFAEWAVHLAQFKDGGCENLVEFASSSRWPKVYRDSRCDGQMAPFGILFLTFMVLRRQRFHHVVLTTASCLAVTALVTIILGPSSGVPTRVLVMNVFWTLGFQAFASFVRYELETFERNFFEAQCRLAINVETLRQRSEEDLQFASSIVPQLLLKRSSHRQLAKLDGIDSTNEGVFLSFTIVDVAQLQTKHTPKALSIIFEELSNRMIGVLEAEPHNMHRVGVLHDEFIFASNVVTRVHVVAAIVGACEGASCVLGQNITANSDQEAGRLLCAAVHVGPAKGGFVGSARIGYSVFGEGLNVCRAASRSMQATGQLGITDEALDVAKDFVEVENERIGFEYRSSGRELTIINSVVPLEIRRQLIGLLSSSKASTDNTSSRRTSNLPSDRSSTSSSAVPPNNPFVGIGAVMRASEQLGGGDNDDPSVERNAPQQQRTWCLFTTFVDKDVEEAYLATRVDMFRTRASRVLLAYSWLQLLLLLLLFADFYPAINGTTAMIVLLFGILASVLLSAVPVWASGDLMQSVYAMWSFACLVMPLLTLFGVALGRPGAVGVDPRPLMLSGALVRAPCFRQSRHQLIAIPFFLIAAHFHILLPGGVLPVPTILIWLLVLYTISRDAESDRLMRREFVVKQQRTKAAEALMKERHVRSGLIETSAPLPLLELWNAGRLTDGLIMTVPDTIIAVVSASTSTSQSTSSSSGSSAAMKWHRDQFNLVEEAASGGQLYITSVFGDSAVMASPVVASAEQVEDSIGNYADQNVAIARNASLLALSRTHSVLVDIDTSIQAVHSSPLPRHSVVGVVVSRLLAVHATGAAAHGVLHSSERYAPAVRATHAGVAGEELGPPLRIRGAGMMRFIQFRAPSL